MEIKIFLARSHGLHAFIRRCCYSRCEGPNRHSVSLLAWRAIRIQRMGSRDPRKSPNPKNKQNKQPSSGLCFRSGSCLEEDVSVLQR